MRRSVQRQTVLLVVLLSAGCLPDRLSDAELEAKIAAATSSEDGTITAADSAAVDADEADAAQDASTDVADDTSADEVDVAQGADQLQEDGDELDVAGDDAGDGDTTATDTQANDANLDTDAADTAVEPGDVGEEVDGDVAADTLQLVCSPGSKTCVGGVVGVCKADGSQLVPGEDCETTGKVCKAGSCEAPLAGYAGSGAFVSVGPSAAGAYVVRQQGFRLRAVCSANYCVRGGIRP